MLVEPLRSLLPNQLYGSGFFCRQHWRAVDPARHKARDYLLEASVDLFGRIVIEQRWGRLGCQGCVKTTSFSDMPAAISYIDRIEAHRITSTRRLGVAYREVISVASRDRLRVPVSV